MSGAACTCSIWPNTGRCGLPLALANCPNSLRQAAGFRALCEDLGAALLVVDPLDAAYMANENDRAQVRAFMANWDKWASDTRCSVLFVAHPNKDAFRDNQGEATFSGSTAWHGASRAIWILGYPERKVESQASVRIEAISPRYSPRMRSNSRFCS